MIAPVLALRREAVVALRLSFFLFWVPTPYLASAQEKVVSVVGATLARCSSLACCFSVI